MKKMLLVGCGVALSAGMAVAQSSLEDLNLVANGSFETEGEPNRPQFWNFSNNGLDSWSDMESVSGIYSVELDAPGTQTGPDNGDWRSDAIPAIVEGETYTFSFFAKSEVLVGNFQVVLRYFSNADATGFISQDVVDISGTTGGDFVFETAEVTAPIGTQSADVIYRTRDFAFGQAFVDDVTVNQNLVQNARFEVATGNPIDAFRWFSSAGANRTPAPGPERGGFVYEIDDINPAGTENLRSARFAVTPGEFVAWGMKTQRTGITGSPAARLRFFSTPAAGTGGFISEASLDLSGDTVGFVDVAGLTEVPAGAMSADIVVATAGDPAILGTILVDDVFAIGGAAPEPCEVDRTGDGVLDMFDVLDYLDAFDMGCP